MSCMSKLANWYVDAGRLGEAIGLHEQLIQRKKAYYGL
jgi:hypothetical protein